MAAPGQMGGEAAQDGNGQQGGEAAQAPDLSSLTEQLGQVASGQEELRQFLASQPWQQQEAEAQQQEPEEPPIEADLSFLDPGDPNYDPEQVSQRLTSLVGQLVNHGVEQGIQQHVAPLREQQAEMRREAEAERLVGEFPELADTDTANEVVNASRQYAAVLGVPQLGDEPAFWRIMYAAGRAFDAAREEGSGDPGAAHLEGGGGANPGASQADQEAANKARVDALLGGGGKRGASVLNF